MTLILLAILLPGCEQDTDTLTPDQVDSSMVDQVVKVKGKITFFTENPMGVGGVYMKLHCILYVGLSLRHALLGFVALYPTYILPVLLRNAKPNNGRFRNRATKVSILIRLEARGQRPGSYETTFV